MTKKLKLNKQQFSLQVKSQIVLATAAFLIGYSLFQPHAAMAADGADQVAGFLDNLKGGLLKIVTPAGGAGFVGGAIAHNMSLEEQNQERAKRVMKGSVVISTAALLGGAFIGLGQNAVK